MINNKKYKCHICNSNSVETLKNYSDLFRVTSDCKPFKKGGKLGICNNCKILQGIVDNKFLHEIKKIYKDYSVYYQANGKEQKIFKDGNDNIRPRSDQIIENVFKNNKLNNTGELLDIGCGNGNFLKSFISYFPNWNLFGLDLDNKYENSISEIINFKKFYSCDIDEIDNKFDIISLLHTIEHIIDPKTFLKKISSKLKKEGLLLIEAPNYSMNPFDLIIADHSIHFDKYTLINLLNEMGFEIIYFSDTIISKEFTILAKIARKNKDKSKYNIINYNEIKNNVNNAIKWLKNVKIKGKHIIRNKKKNEMFGIFGTSIASTWISYELDNKIDFYVDEDEDRINKLFLNKKVYHPSELQNDWITYIVLNYNLSTKILNKLNKYNNSRYILPNK